jgi:Ca2+-binding RTX toxin-like protein
LTYYYGLDDGEMIINAGELTRTYGGGGADDFDSTYAYDYFDGSTLDEIAAYYQQYHPDVDYAVALQWATDNRALREAGNFNDWSEGGAGNDYLYGGDGEDYLDGGADKDYINGGGGDDILIAGDGAENLLNGSGQNDLLIGGAGVDYLFGDAHVVPVDRYPSGDEWFVTREGHDVIFHNCSLSFGWTGGDMDGDDRIYAGAGNYHVVVV